MKSGLGCGTMSRPNIDLGRSGMLPYAILVFESPASSSRICCSRISRYRCACSSKAEWRGIPQASFMNVPCLGLPPASHQCFR